MRRRNPLEQLQWSRLLLVALVALTGFLVWDRWQTARRLRDPKHLVELANALEGDANAARYAQMVEETRALAKKEFAELRALLSEAQVGLELLRPAVVRLDTLLEEVRTTSKGSGIAADRDALEQFHAATAEFGVTPEKIDQHLDSVKTLQAPVEAALAEQLFDKSPTTDFKTSVEALCQSIARDKALVSETAAKVKVILDAAPSSPGTGALLLSDALQQLEQEWAVQDAKAAQEAQDKVRAEYREKLAKETAESERQIAEAKLEKERAERGATLAAERQAAEIAARKHAEAMAEVEKEEARRVAEREAKLKAEAEEREYQAALPEIEKYLSGIITPGHKQLVRDRWVFTEETKPLSYSAMKARHMMRKDNTGQLYFVSYVASEGNDREKGVFSGYRPGAVPPAMVPDIVRAQNLLEKYADKLIEHGKLLP